jgi:hypothetical protein
LKVIVWELKQTNTEDDAVHTAEVTKLVEVLESAVDVETLV